MKSIPSLALIFLLPAAGLAQDDPAVAWSKFLAANGSEWTAQWNTATGTPSAIYGQGLKLAGPVASLEAARVEATALFARYDALLGKGGSNFVEQIGVKANRVYILVYDQRYKGLDVISGRADVRINDIGVVAMFGSSAVAIPGDFNMQPALAAAAAKAIAEGKVLGGPSAKQGGPAPRLVIWADTESAVPTKATLAWEVQIDETPKQLQVGKAYVDAVTGAFLQFNNEVFTCHSCGKDHVSGRNPHAARMDRARAMVANLKPTPSPKGMMALNGKVMAWTNLNITPFGALTNVPLPNLRVTSSAGSATTDSNGNFSIPYTGTTNVTVTATLVGSHTQRIRVASGTQMSASASISPTTGGTIQFGTSTMGDLERSQTTTYWYVNDVNEWFRGLLPTATGPMAQLSGMNPRVNINASCNAYYTNFTINFYNAGGTCNMTAFSTVIQHEWGHGADHAFGGISQTDGLSEGWGDILGIYRTDQPVLGAGFRTNGGSVRDGRNTLTYPAGGGVHQQGQTWMGFAWDYRQNLRTKFGTPMAIQISDDTVVKSIAADATNQPNAVREVFILDDDDGNLNNGVPHYDSLSRAAIKRNLPYPIRVNPNAGTYVTYGAGCAGSGTKVGLNCFNMNANGSVQNAGTRANLTYAIRATAPQDLQIVGFDLNTSGSQTVTTRLYSANPSGQPATALATGSMVVGGGKNWYRTTFGTPVTIKQGQQFFVAFVNNASTISASLRSGTQTPYFRNDGPGGSWNGPLTGFSWTFRVNCVGGPGAVPSLSATGVPEINQSFSLNLNSGKPSTNGLLLIGGSDSSWGSLTLPLNLAPFGATGCSLLASGEITQAISTNAQGASTQNFAVPNDASLFGIVFFNQYTLTDNANTFGVVFSNAGKGKVGKQ